MKTMLTFLLLIASFRLTAFGQPIENHGEFYYIGNVIQMVNCDTTGFDAGIADTNVIWDFTGLQVSGAMYVTSYSNETSTGFIPSNIVAHLPNGLKMHEQQNSTDTYLIGTEDTTAGVIRQYSNYKISKRPLTYNSTYLDTFYTTVPATGEFGRGYLSVIADAYGTLKLPSGTFNNVLRVKKVLTEGDTLGSSAIRLTNTVSYFWFDTLHHSPLLRMEDISGTSTQSKSIMYIASPSAVVNIAANEVEFTGYLYDNELLLSGNFETGGVYEVAMYNIIGSMILKEDFITSGNNYHFDISKQVTPGIYIVGLTQKNDPYTKKVIKVFKQ